MTTLEDFLNLDMLSSSSSRDSSQSPDSSFLGLPQTPPQPMEHNVPNVGDAQSLFSFYFDKEMEKIIEQQQQPAFQPFEMFSSLSPQDSGSASSASPIITDDPNFFAIDPQLMAVPPRQQSLSSSSIREELEDDEDEDDYDDIMAAVKVGGKGRAGRKGTVSSGGIKKFGGQAVRDGDDPEDWRPTVEEYKKMSSKEKRQLRNKISARNFRVRRKEYITTLEGDISERDRLIDLIREELGSTKLENAALRKEVDALKRAMLDGRAAPTLPPPGPLDEVTAATDAATAAPTARTTRARAPLAKANTQKDLPTTSPRSASARPFWGGSASLGGITPVHTTLVPDFVSLYGISEKQAAVANTSSPTLQENINPALNANWPPASQAVSGVAQSGVAGGFDHFTDLNPFTLKNLEAYRMQLWSKMARDMGAKQQQHTQLTGLASSVKPLFLDSTNPKEKKDSPVMSALFSGKGALATSPKPQPQAEHAMLAAMASHTLLSRMTGAFWDAFTGTGPSKKDWDAEKVRRVLEGTAVVRVVDVEPKVDPAAALEESMRAMSLKEPARATSLKESLKDTQTKKDCCEANCEAATNVFHTLRNQRRSGKMPTA